jgi:hypothetical protein
VYSTQLFRKIELVGYEKGMSYPMNLNVFTKKKCNELDAIMDKWCHIHSSENYQGGKMRSERGEDIEMFVRKTIEDVSSETGSKLIAKRGSEDKKELVVDLEKEGKGVEGEGNGVDGEGKGVDGEGKGGVGEAMGGKGKKSKMVKRHQVDVHVYKDEVFVATIECKAFLDSCFYVRACDDFRLFRKFGYPVKNYIFTLENSMNQETKRFTDIVTDFVCDDVFYILDGKRQSTKPIFNPTFRKKINIKNMQRFLEFIIQL